MRRRISTGSLIPFFTTKEHGTGLGLPVAHQIMTQMGGSLLAERGPTKGMIFSLVPARKALRFMIPARILVVDDDENLRWVVKTQLEEFGYMVSEAGDGEQALTIIAKEPPALVLTDLKMPGL